MQNEVIDEKAVPYHVALSFAGEQRTYVDQVAQILKSKGVNVFYDRFEEASLWGTNLYSHLRDVYTKQARFTVMFISAEYKNKLWTNHERESAQARAFQENQEYILPARFDDTEIPGLLSTVGYVDLRNKQPDQLCALIVQKLSATGVILPPPPSTSAEEELSKTKIRLSFNRVIDLKSPAMEGVLQDYYQDLLHHQLDGFMFVPNQLIVENDTNYDVAINSMPQKRVLGKLEKGLVDGCVQLLNRAYLKDKQVDFCHQACFWFARQLRLRSLISMQEAGVGLDGLELPDSVLPLGSTDFFTNPSRYFGFDVMKIDVWHPDNRQLPMTSVWVPKDGYLGNWFSRNPQRPGPLTDHFDPRDYYNFVLSGMMIHHIFNRKPIIEDWSGYWVGAA
jgi:hypothetical protein